MLTQESKFILKKNILSSTNIIVELFKDLNFEIKLFKFNFVVLVGEKKKDFFLILIGTNNVISIKCDTSYIKKNFIVQKHCFYEAIINN